MQHRTIRQAVRSVLFRPSVADLYDVQVLNADGSDKGECRRLSYIDARTFIQLAAPDLTRVELDHIFALTHAAKGGPVEANDIDKEKGALKFSARLSYVTP
jgi:hypothetical protein